jgi:hypothetical protein
VIVNTRQIAGTQAAKIVGGKSKNVTPYGDFLHTVLSRDRQIGNRGRLQTSKEAGFLLAICVNWSASINTRNELIPSAENVFSSGVHGETWSRS